MPGKRGAPVRSRSSRLSRSSSLTVRNSWPEARSSPTVRGRSVRLPVGTSGASVTQTSYHRPCDNRRRVTGTASSAARLALAPGPLRRRTLSAMTDIEILRYTAFSADPAGGNPAGVVLDASSLSDAEMLAIAADVGYSETAFLTAGTGRAYRGAVLQSPLVEVAFCGHATVAHGGGAGAPGRPGRVPAQHQRRRGAGHRRRRDAGDADQRPVGRAPDRGPGGAARGAALGRPPSSIRRCRRGSRTPGRFIRSSR